MTTESLRLPKGIKSITLVHADPAGGDEVEVTVFKPEKKRKKQSRELRGLEKLLRRSARAQRAFHETYLERHERSNGKRRDGWIRDLTTNLLRAQRAGRKRMKLIKLVGG